MHKYVFIAILSCLYSGTFAQQPSGSASQAIAVMTLKNSSGVTPDEAVLLSDRFGIELQKTGNVTVIEREKMQQLLAEQGLAASGACADEACQSRMGQMLGAQKIVSGSIGKLGSLYMVSIRLVNVQTSAIEKTASRDVKGEIENVVGSLSGLAQELVADIPLYTNNNTAVTAITKQEQPKAANAGLTVQSKKDTLSAYVTVLPIERKGIDSSLAMLLTDEFRKYLNESRSFKVMERDLMEKILKEQAFQMTGAVDEAYMVKVGKIIGVNRIVSASVVKLDNGAFAVSAKMVDVETGAILNSVSEKRNGDSFEIIRRMLNNCAFALAGVITQDRQEYLALASQETKDAQKVEKIGAKRFRISLGGGGSYPLHIMQNSDEATRRKYYESATDMVAWGVPKETADLECPLSLGLRLSPSWWLIAKGRYMKTKAQSGYAISDSYFDTSLTTGFPATTVRSEMNDTILSRTSHNYEVFSLGLGLKYVFFRNSRVSLGLSLIPQIGSMTYYSNEYDSSMSTNYIYTSVFNKTQYYTQTTYQTKLTGIAYGGELGADAELFIFSNLGISLSCGLNVLMAASLQGTSNVHKYEITNTDGNVQIADTTRSENATMVHGNFLGTGDYFQIQNADRKQYDPSGKVVSITKPPREFSTVHIEISLVYYF
jgi:curli biogenesis system outer membrane secretion channel CsgG